MFDEDSTRVSHGLEMSSSRSSETPSLVVADESSKPIPSNKSEDDGNSMKEDLEDHEVEDVAPSPTSTPSVGDEEESTQEPRYPRRERRPLAQCNVGGGTASKGS